MGCLKIPMCNWEYCKIFLSTQWSHLSPFLSGVRWWAVSFPMMANRLSASWQELAFKIFISNICKWMDKLRCLRLWGGRGGCFGNQFLGLCLSINAWERSQNDFSRLFIPLATAQTDSTNSNCPISDEKKIECENPNSDSERPPKIWGGREGAAGGCH